MDNSVSKKLRELEAKCTIMRNEINTTRTNLKNKKDEIYSAVSHYKDIEGKLIKLYDAEERARDDLNRFKMEHNL